MIYEISFAGYRAFIEGKNYPTHQLWLADYFRPENYPPPDQVEEIIDRILEAQRKDHCTWLKSLVDYALWVQQTEHSLACQVLGEDYFA